MAQTTNKAKENEKVNAEDSLLREFFVDGLKDIYWAEQHLLKAMPKMEQGSTSKELKSAFKKHQKETEGHIKRLEEVFDEIGEKAQAKKCEAMAGLLKEGQDIMDETEEGTVTRDVALIMAAQKVEHYEIATYGGLKQLAMTLGYKNAASTLATTLDEEKRTDDTLTGIAENDINYQASLETAQAN